MNTVLEKSPRIILALDMSLSGTGIAIVDGNGSTIHLEKLSSEKMNTKKYKGQTRLRVINNAGEIQSESYIESSNLLDMQRVSFYKNRISELIDLFGVNEVIIEGYSFNSKGRSVISLGELGGVIRYSIFEKGIKYYQCPPFNAKVFLTGLTFASKEQMIEGIKANFGIEIKDDNIADAYAMAQLLATHGELTETYLSEGGVDKLRAIKANVYRLTLPLEESFRKILDLGVLTEDDLAKALDNDLDLPELAGIEDASKKNVNRLNKEYKLKKPKK